MDLWNRLREGWTVAWKQYLCPHEDVERGETVDRCRTCGTTWPAGKGR